MNRENKKFGELICVRTKIVENPIAAIKGVMPFSKKYIGAYQPLADNIIITL